MIVLRDYQKQVVSKMLWSLNLDGNSVVSVAQGGGKTLIIAEFVRQLGKPVLVLVPSKELLIQDLEELENVVPGEVGVYSASMNSKEVKDITIGTIQSCYKHPELFAHYEVAMVDECDLIDPKNMEGMYNTFFKAIGIKTVIGLTGTPFRMGVMYERWGPQKWMMNANTVTRMISRARERFWDRIISVVNIKDLQDQGYLVPMTYHDKTIFDHEEIPTNKTKSEFDLEVFDSMMWGHYTRIADFIKYTPHNKKLVFCTSVTQATTLSSLIPNSAVVTSETPSKERTEAIRRFREGESNILLGVNIFSIGFNVPDIDCIIALRPTRSLRLWTQVLGRGSRIADGKTTCHVYDFVGNLKSLGTFESMEIKKINNLWNVVTNIRPEGFHGEKLFSYQLRKPKTEQLF